MPTLSSSPLLPNFNWPLEDMTTIISQEYNSTFYRDDDISINQTSDHSLVPSPNSHLPIAAAQSNFTVFGDDRGAGKVVIKKLNHNASERDRRKKINTLYSSLFSLLPAADQTKKLSIPATVASVVKYIPELQKEVERLTRKKEQLSSRIPRHQEADAVIHPLEKRRKFTAVQPSLSRTNVMVTPLVNTNEILIQISALKFNNNSLSHALKKLEDEDGLVLLNAASFESLGDKVFHNLHFQGHEIHEVDKIRWNILSVYYEKDEEMLQVSAWNHNYHLTQH